MNYDLLRAYVGHGQQVSIPLIAAMGVEVRRIHDLDPAGVLSTFRAREIAAAIVMVQFRAEYSHLQTRIKAGDGTEETLWFDIQDRQSDPAYATMATLMTITGSRTLYRDVEAVEMLGAEVFIREAIRGRF